MTSKRNPVNLDRALITGASGMLGSYVDFGIRTTRETLDLSECVAVVERVATYAPSAIIHLAAETNVDASEEHPESAFAINSAGTYYLALAARKLAIPMVYISTGGIFDGLKKGPYTPEDVPNPQNVYSHSKYLGELAVSGLLSDYLIVRTGWLFGGGPARDRKFVGNIYAQLEHPVIKAVEDQHGSPTYAKDVVEAIRSLLSEGKRGIVNVVNAGVASRYDMAKEIVAITGSKATVTPVSLASFTFSATRVRNESLAVGSVVLRPWQEALRDYLTREWQGNGH